MFSNPAFSVDCGFSAPLWPSAGFFVLFFVFNCVSHFQPSSDCLVPRTPDAFANHICLDEGGGPLHSLQVLISEIRFQSEEREKGLPSKLKGIMLQAFDCMRRQNPRTGRKSSEVF